MDDDTLDRHSLTLGIEEELFVIDENTLDLVTQVPPTVFDRFNARYPEQLTGEFLPSQVEIITRPCDSIAVLEDQFRELRRTLIQILAEHGMRALAASTHPKGHWLSQVPRDNPRYNYIAERLKITVNRLLVCGYHIHIGIDDNATRIRVNNQLSWYLPFILSLTTSSPYWAGFDTGYNCHRLSVMHSVPRTGLPPVFANYADYQQYVAALKNANEIQDESEIWWDARLSCRFPTVEMRITDTCTRFQDVIAVAALYQCLVRYLIRQPMTLSRHSELIAKENAWIALRYPIHEAQIIADNEGSRQAYTDTMHALLDALEEDALILDCTSALNQVRDILKNGTSADRQRAVYQQAVHGGRLHEAALSQVIKHTVEETERDVL